MLDRMLVTLDGSKKSEGILPVAAAIAQAAGCEVGLLYVADPGLYQDVSGTGREAIQEHLLRDTERWAAGYLATAQEPMTEKGIKTSAVVDRGVPDEVIARRAQAGKVGLIAMSTRGRSGLARLTLGSTAERVIARTTVPLLLYSSDSVDESFECRNVLLPLDGSALAEKATALATFFATVLKAPLTLVRVVPDFASSPVGAPIYAPLVAADLEREAGEYLQTTANRLRGGGLPIDIQVINGDPAVELTGLAQDLPGSMVVVSSRGRTGFPLMILGSVADKLVRHSNRPVVIVHAGKKAPAVLD